MTVSSVGRYGNGTSCLMCALSRFAVHTRISNRYSQFRRLHREIQKSFGWQFEQSKAEFPAKTFFNDVSPAFNETRKEALNDYFKRVRTIPKIMEFDKHHSCVALRDFVEYANHCDKKVDTSSTRRSSTLPSNNSSSGLRSSRNRFSSRRGMRSSVGSRQQSSSSIRQQERVSQEERPRPPAEDPSFSTSSSSSSSDDPRFVPFKKMLQMHLPEGAVRHKMCASGFTDQEIDSFLGGGSNGASNGVSNASSSSSSSSSVRCLENITLALIHKLNHNTWKTGTR